MNNKKRLIIGIGLFLLFAGTALITYSIHRSRNGSTGNIRSIFPLIPIGPTNTANPFRILNLSNWKLTLPIPDPNNPTQPLEILQPQLATYQLNPWFMTTPDGKGIIFRAPVNAPTTINSSYPRSELREMTNNGTQESFWPSTSGTHTLYIDEAITATSKNKPDVVAGQIHGDTSDLIVVRLEGQNLYLTRNKANLYTLENNYVLGTRFTVKFVVSNGQVAVYYNNGANPVYTLAKNVQKAYFKVGVYTQSNCQTEGSPDLCTSDNYGEVIVYQAQVTHQ